MILAVTTVLWRLKPQQFINNVYISRPTWCTNSYNVSLFIIKRSICFGLESIIRSDVLELYIAIGISRYHTSGCRVAIATRQHLVGLLIYTVQYDARCIQRQISLYTIIFSYQTFYHQIFQTQVHRKFLQAVPSTLEHFSFFWGDQHLRSFHEHSSVYQRYQMTYSFCHLFTCVVKI